jgi:hypothetical protein
VVVVELKEILFQLQAAQAVVVQVALLALADRMVL